MLMLSREVEESIDVDGPCRITIVRIEGGRVRIGINGPPSTKVLRTELITNGEHHDGTDRGE